MKIGQNFKNLILFTTSIIGIVSTWTCSQGSNGTFKDGDLCPQTADCRYDQLGSCEHVTIDPCTCCPTCPVPAGNSCSSAGSPNFGGICQNDHFCILDGAKNRHSSSHKTGICLSSDMLVDLRCDNGTNFSGCTIYSEQCICQNVKLCPNLSAIFPFPDKKSCQEKLNSILRYELDSNPPSDKDLRCPSDSVEVSGSGAQNSIGFSKELSLLENSSQFHCRCDMRKCHVTCKGKSGGPQFDLKLLSPGNDKIPGKCCPTYECLPTPHNKSHVNCRDAICPHDEAEFACSSDSIILPSLFTHDHCCPVPQGCQCLKDLCQSPPICKDGQWPSLTFRGNGIPGSCCDVFTCQDIESKSDIKEDLNSCKSGDVLYENGARWDKDPCVTCYCRAGLTFCQTKNCSSEYCHLHTNDTCCPECQPKRVMCVSESGIKYQSNDTWTESDCVHCTCNVNGRVECISQMCALPRDCDPDDIVKIAGVCCPICQTNVSNEITNANPIKHTTNGTISNMASSLAPNLHCHSKQLNLYFAPEQTWAEDCRRCYCMDGITLCTLLSCPIPKCEKPFYLPGDCCPLCPGLLKAAPYSNYTECKVLRSPYANVISDVPSLVNEMIGVKTLDSSYFYPPKLSNGVYDSWWIDDCINCICRDGIVYCSVSECKPTPCHFPQSFNGPTSCCQGCLNEIERRTSHKNHDRALAINPSSFCKSADGQLYANGALWYQDPCNSCKCHLDKVKCYSTICPKQYCDKPLLQKGKCCPLCLGNVGNIPIEVDAINTLSTTPLDLIPDQDQSNDKWHINLPGIVFYKRRAYFSYESLPFLLLLVLCVLLLFVVVYLLIYIYVKRDKLIVNQKKPPSPRVKKFRFFKLSPHNLMKKSLLLHSPNLKESSTYKQTTEVQGDNYTALASMPDLEDPKLELEENSEIYELKPTENYKIFAIDYDTDSYLKGFENFTGESTKDAKAESCDKTMLSEDSGLTQSRNSSHSESCKSSISSFNKSYYCLAPQREPHENDLLVEKMV